MKQRDEIKERCTTCVLSRCHSNNRHDSLEMTIINDCYPTLLYAESIEEKNK